MPNVLCRYTAVLGEFRQAGRLTLPAIVGAVKHGENVDNLAAQGAYAIEADRRRLLVVLLALSSPAASFAPLGCDAAAGAHEVERGGGWLPAQVADVGGITGRLEEEA